MKPTQQEIIELAREAGITTIHNGYHPVSAFTADQLERFTFLLLERFGAGGGEPVAWEMYNPTTGHAIVDYSRQTYVGHLKQEDGYEARPLYSHPAPTDLRAEYVRGLDDAAKVCDEYSGNWYAYRKGAEQCAASIRALKGKQ